jgi:hypothetical protein
MIADAREDSLAAAKLYESLVQIVARYRGVGTTAEKESNGVDGEIPAETLRCLPEDVVGEGRRSSQINDAILLDLVDWDDLFSSVSSSPFF